MIRIIDQTKDYLSGQSGLHIRFAHIQSLWRNIKKDTDVSLR